jgi:hypothetical protein
MIAKREWTQPAPSPATGRSVGLVMGHRLTLELDDDDVTAELRKLGIWPKVADEVRLGRSWLVAYPTKDGLSVFLWLGKPGDSGFARFYLEGVAPVCPASLQLLASLRGMVKKFDREEYFDQASLQPPTGHGC